MKKLICLLTAVLVVCLLACKGGDDPTTGSAGGTKELTLGEKQSGTISTAGEVDWYHFRAAEANNILQVSCTSNTLRPDVELLVTAYEEEADGSLRRLQADHAPRESQLPADIKMNLYVERPKDIYVAVRDLMDDAGSNNPYYIGVAYAQAADGNGNFAQALSLGLDDPEGCRADDIGTVGDADCFTFQAPIDGVYGLGVDFAPLGGDSPVTLSVELYDHEGGLVDADHRGSGNRFELRPYLAAGSYYVLVDDVGRDDFDPASPYHVCIQTVAVDEADANDGLVDAQPMAVDPLDGAYAIEAALEYDQDEDWYRLPLADIVTTRFKVLDVRFDGGPLATGFEYQVGLQDGSGEILWVHDFRAGSLTYETHIKAGGGDHFVVVRPAPGNKVSQEAAYRLSVLVLDVEDPAETTVKILADGSSVSGNDTIFSADRLDPGSDPLDAVEAKIGYRGDEDWYLVEVAATGSPRILSVFLDTDGLPGLVEYDLSIMRDVVAAKRVDTNGADGGTQLQAGIWVPAFTVPSALTYYIKVCDVQGDDGDGQVPYRIRADLEAVPDVLPADPFLGPDPRRYFNETEEFEDILAAEVRLEMTSLIQRTLRADTTLLDFSTDDPGADVTKTANADGTTTIVFPWIGGYVDYQGDQDWFRLCLQPLVETGQLPAEKWYYDIRVDLHTGVGGSEVEYVWKFYRDVNQNQIMVDRPGDSNGFFASAGDADTVAAAFDLTVPAAGGNQQFWVGDAWQGDFYLSLSDFNYVAADHPDDDWGYGGSPYYFRVTLGYHPGLSYPQ